MKEKKHIDRIFQEKFKDFEASPRDAVWHKISKNLQEENQKEPVIRPLWMRLAGIAALAAFLLLLGDWFLQPKAVPQITDSKEVEVDLTEEKSTIANNNPVAPDSEENEAAVSGLQDDSSSIPEERAALSQVSSIISHKETNEVQKFISIPLAGLIQVKNFDIAQEEKNINKNIFEQVAEEAVSEKAQDLKFEISTHAAPVFYGNMNKTSFIDPKFNDNSSSGTITYSYGINIAYKISEDLKLRSGVNKVALSYNTDDIIYHAVINPSAISAIDYTEEIITNEINNLAAAKGSSQQAVVQTRAAVGNFDRGFLNQQIGFIEIPVELEYNVIDRKIRFSIIGGTSTLFLDDNMISVHTSSLSTKLGAANNLSNISFSTNVGLGLDYNLSPNLQLNVEPMFKYQLNAFEAASQVARPYYLAIYSGFSFRF